MTIDIFWATTKRIFVPRADMALVQASPEVRELDVDVFRLALKDLESAAEGMAWPDTHRHVTETTLSGAVYARLVEVLPPYFVEFEDGQYSVRAVGANHNILDRKINNQVSFAAQNSAGLINSPEIQFASYEGAAVHVDPVGGSAGTNYPVGTRRRPVSNLADALAIAAAVGLNRLHLMGDMTLDSGLDFQDMEIFGEGRTRTNVVVAAPALVQGCTFGRMKVSGTLDGFTTLRDCVLGDLTYVDGVIEACALGDSATTPTITLSSSQDVQVVDCWDGVAGFGVPTVDMGGAGSALVMRGYRGAVQLTNKTGPEEVSIDGHVRVVLAASVTGSGQVVLRGVGSHTHAGTAPVNADDLVSPASVADATLSEPVAGHSAGSLGAAVTSAESQARAARKYATNRMEIDYAAQELIFWDDDGTTVLLRLKLTDASGGSVVAQPGIPARRQPL